MSLDVLKLYSGEDVVQQEPADVDPDGWVEEGELPETPVRERDRVFLEASMDAVNLKVMVEPGLEVPMILDDPEEMAVREGIHEIIQTEINHEDREREVQAEEMLDNPPEWNEMEDLVWEGVDILEDMRPEKRRRDEISLGRRKRRKEGDIRAEKQEHSPTLSWWLRNPEGFYSEDWDEEKQEKDEWQIPDKFQKISQMVFRNGILESPSVGDRVFSSHRVQHQGGRCSK